MSDTETAMAVLVALSGFARGTPVVFKSHIHNQPGEHTFLGWVGVYERTYVEGGEVGCRVVTTGAPDLGLQFIRCPVDEIELLDGVVIIAGRDAQL